MTAFARTQRELAGNLICWEIRSVNHRYLDVSFRLPDSWRFLETELRSLLRGKIARGKLECQLRLQESSAKLQSLPIDENFVANVLSTADNLAQRWHIANDLGIAALFSLPGIFKAEMSAEQFVEPILQLFSQAITELTVTRAHEGALLLQEIGQRAEKLATEIAKARQIAHEAVGVRRDKLFQRLEEMQLALESQRIEQELALLLTKMDVHEELDRLGLHQQEIARIIAKNEPAGRRLDFLMQELNREANTLSSKSDSVALTQCAVEMKVLIEQMREQIQNIE